MKTSKVNDIKLLEEFLNDLTDMPKNEIKPFANAVILLPNEKQKVKTNRYTKNKRSL